MAPHTRLENIQPPPTMDGIILVTINGLMYDATNEPMAFMLEDLVEIIVSSWKKLFQSKQLQLIIPFVINLISFFGLSPPSQKGWWGVFFFQKNFI
jgi:hypothetical protein